MSESGIFGPVGQRLYREAGEKSAAGDDYGVVPSHTIATEIREQARLLRARAHAMDELANSLPKDMSPGAARLLEELMRAHLEMNP